jgi:hypothetical protein
MFVPFSCSLALAAAPEVVALSADRGGETVLTHTSGALAGLPFDTWIDRADPRVVELAKVGVFVDPWGGIKFRPRATTPPTGEVVLPYRTPTGGGSRTLTWKVREVDAPPFAPTLGLAPGSELIVDLRPLDDAGAVSPPTLTVDDPQVTVTCEDWSCRLAAKPKTKGRLKYRVADAGGAWAEGYLVVGARGAPPIAAPPLATTKLDTAVELPLAPAPDTWVVVTRAPVHGQLSLNDHATLKYRPDPGFAGSDSVEYVVRGPWGATQRLIAPIRVDGTPTARRPPDRPLPVQPVDGRWAVDLAEEAIGGYPPPDGVRSDCQTLKVTQEGTKAVVSVDPTSAGSLELLDGGAPSSKVTLDFSHLRDDVDWCKSTAATVGQSDPETYLLCIDTASDKRRITVIHRSKLGANRSTVLARPGAPMVLAVRTRDGVVPELDVKSDDSVKVPQLLHEWTTLTESGPNHELFVYRVDRDNPAGLTKVTVRVKDDRGAQERTKTIVTGKPWLSWTREHVLFPSVVADPTLVPPGARLVTDASLVVATDAANVLTTADLISSDFYVVRLGVRGSVTVAEGDGEPQLGILSLPTDLAAAEAFQVFSAGAGAWATFPLLADDWRRGSDDAERWYNLSLGGRLGLDPLRTEDQVPYGEGFLEGAATLASFSGDRSLAITAKAKAGLAYASEAFASQLALDDRRVFSWYVARGGIGQSGGPSVAIQLSGGPVERVGSRWSVVVDLGR